MLRDKKTAGFTLIELLVTLALVTIILVPIMRMFVASSETTMASNDLSTAALTAQLRMEELVGLTRDELCEEFGVDAENLPLDETLSKTSSYNGFDVTATVVLKYEVAGVTYPELAEAVVSVSKDGKELFSQTNILNVSLYGGEADSGDET